MKAYVIYSLRIDSLENEFSSARGYDVIGVCLDKEIAQKIVSNSGFYIGSGWPFPKGTKVQKNKMEEVEILK